MHYRHHITQKSFVLIFYYTYKIRKKFVQIKLVYLSDIHISVVCEHSAQSAASRKLEQHSKIKFPHVSKMKCADSWTDTTSLIHVHSIYFTQQKYQTQVLDKNV